MIPKPKYCDQNWLTMQKAKGGRICGDCQKVMTDFTKMSWSKIEHIHTNSNEPVCGMYSQKQLDNWGQDVPSSFLKCSKSAAVLTSIFAALNFQSAEAKPLKLSKEAIHFASREWEEDSIPRKNLPNSKIKIGGTITFKDNDEPIIGATVILKNSTLGTVSNADGRFELEISDSIQKESKILEISYIGYTAKEILLDYSRTNHSSLSNLSIRLEPDPNVSITYFGIRQPTPKEKRKHKWQRFKNWFKNLFN